MSKIIPIHQTICKFAWDYSVLNLSRNELRNCCRSKSHLITDADWKLDIDLFNHFEPLIKVKEDLLRGIKNEACNVCWEIESKGVKSARTGFDVFVQYIKTLKLFPNLTEQQLKDKLENLNQEEIYQISRTQKTNRIEISLGNTCDLKCVYCSHHCSSQWATEKLKYGEIKPEEIEVELPKIKDEIYETLWWQWFTKQSGHDAYHINFIGGEPLLIDKFYHYVDRICNFYQNVQTNQEKVYFSLISNFNTPKKLYDRFLNTTMNILSVDKLILDINCSVESIGVRSEYIRTGTDWALLVNNLENYINFLNEIDPNHEQTIVSLQIALNSLCISDLPNFFKWVIDLQNRTNRKIHLRQNQVNDPQWLSPSILPTHYSKYIDETIEILRSQNINHDEYNILGKWNHYVSHLQRVKSTILHENKKNIARAEFAYNIKKLDHRRGLNFSKTFPEMVDFMNECQSIQVENSGNNDKKSVFLRESSVLKNT